jgi:hypothetical protein
MPFLPLLPWYALFACDAVEVRSPIVVHAQASAPEPAVTDPEGAADETMRFIRDFCSRDWTPDALREYVAPQAVQAGGIPLPAGMPYWFTNGTVTTVYTPREVYWWMNPKEGQPFVTEIHAVPVMATVTYRDFVARTAFSAEVDARQDHPLSDILHRFFYTCEGTTVEVTLNEVVWQGDAVGKLGQVGIVRR